MSVYKIDTNLSRYEMTTKLLLLESTTIASIRLALYDEAIKKQEFDGGRRKMAAGNSVKEKHVNDIYGLVCSIKNRSTVDRVLLRNGKRSLTELNTLRSTTRAANDVNPNSNGTPARCAAIGASTNTASSANPTESMAIGDRAFRSSVVCDIQALKKELDEIKSRLTSISNKKECSSWFTIHQVSCI